MLSRDKILDAALGVIRSEGLIGLSQRRLAKELGVSPMAMYRHFRDKDELVHALLDHVVDPESLLAVLDDDVEESLVRVFVSLRAVFVAEPALAPLAGTPASLGPKGFAFLEGLLQWLLGHDVDTERATRLIHLGLTYTLGASLMAAGAASSDAVKHATAHFDGLSATDYPGLVAAGPELLTFVSDARFEDGLRRITSAS